MGESLSVICAPVCCCGSHDRAKEYQEYANLPAAPIIAELVWRNLFAEIKCPTNSENVHETLAAETHVSSTPSELVGADSEIVLQDSPSFGGRRGRRGTDILNERRLNAERDVTAIHVAAVPQLEASVSELGNGKWRVHGIHEQKVLHAGLLRLDSMLERGDITLLPCNNHGRSLVFCHSLFQALLTGVRMIKDVPQAEAASAQKDLPHLSLRQLLRLRALNIDFAPGGNSVHATLLSMVDVLIFQRLGKKATDSDDPARTAELRDLGRTLVILIALAKYFSATHCWICWFEDRRIFFDTVRLACTECTSMGIEAGALEYVDKSEYDRLKGGESKWLDFSVRLITSETELGTMRNSSPGQKTRPGVKCAVSTEEELKHVRGALKSVHPVKQVD